VKEIRLLVADPRPIVCAGISALLERFPDLQIVAEASDGPAALQSIQQHQPDVALIESTMSMLDGTDVTTCITRDWPGVHVIVVSTDREDSLRRAFEIGATGYLTIATSPEELEFAVRTVANDRPYVGPSATTRLVEFARVRELDESLERLSPRQREVLLLTAQGNSLKQIALLLNISVKTVETHRRLLSERLGIHHTAGLVRYAVKAGLIRLED
jgi:RNA polymerase sigma factor (sigma-70 family)